MRLTYRGVQYGEEKQYSSALIAETVNKQIVDRGNYPQAKINPKFPWLAYVKQLIYSSKSKPILDPIAFSYNYKREFIEECWHLDNTEKLVLALNLTIQIERAKNSQSRQKTKLKYRGVTYYK